MDTEGKLSLGILEIVKHHHREAGESESSTLSDYLHSAGRATEACLYWVLFCPELLEVDGSVLLERAVETEAEQARFRQFMREEGRQTAESSFNFVEVPYLFGPQGRNLSDEEDHILAHAMAQSWRAWLGFQYPQRVFEVEVMEPTETGSVVGIHFWERV